MLEQKLKAGTIAGYQMPEVKQGEETKEKKKSKYNNTKIEVGGKLFDSKKEAFRYRELSLLQKLGEISGLTMQVRYLVIEATNTTKEAYYVADFVYILNNKDSASLEVPKKVTKMLPGTIIVEDVKSTITRKMPTYVLKKKLMKTVYNIDIKES